MPMKTLNGLPVLDAKRKFTLRVTESDIKKSTKRTPAGCAIAQACYRQLHVKEARIHLGRTYLRTNDTNWVRYQTPSSARSEIIAFDRGGTFEPTEITFRPVCVSERLGTSRNSGPRLKNGRQRASPHVVTNVRRGPA